MMQHSRKKRNWFSRDSYSKHVIGFMEQSMIYLNEKSASSKHGTTYCWANDMRSDIAMVFIGGANSY